MRAEKVFFHLKTALIVLALGLTFLSWSQICSSACEEVHNWKIFGWTFEPIGLFFFTGLFIMHLYSNRFSFLVFLISFTIALAVGSEFNFILVQSEIIGRWCPVCLTIAGTIFALAIVQVIHFFWERYNLRGVFMRGFATLFAVFIGFVIAFIGVTKPEKSFAEGISPGFDPSFGNQNSPIEIYIVSDWFCPACENAEPTIQGLAPLLKREAKVYFIDYAIHPESMNFTPYNLSFMIYEKDKYFSLRRALSRLTKRTQTPALADVEEAIRPVGATYRPLNFTDVNSGVRFFNGIVKAFGITRTPTVVIANRDTLDARKLSGEDITRRNILEAIKELKK